MIKILFICHGNICRSPMAEFVFRQMAGQEGLANQFDVYSAATTDEEIWNGCGNPVYPPVERCSEFMAWTRAISGRCC